MALTARVIREFVGEQDEDNVLLADSDIYYAGGIVCNSSGKAANIAAVAESQFALGILTGEYDDGDRVEAKTIGSSNTIRAKVKRGKVWLPHGSAAITDVGGLFTPDTDNSLADVPSTANKRYYGYIALNFKTGYVLVDLRNPIVADNET